MDEDNFDWQEFADAYLASTSDASEESEASFETVLYCEETDEEEQMNLPFLNVSMPAPSSPPPPYVPPYEQDEENADKEMTQLATNLYQMEGNVSDDGSFVMSPLEAINEEEQEIYEENLPPLLPPQHFVFPPPLPPLTKTDFKQEKLLDVKPKRRELQIIEEDLQNSIDLFNSVELYPYIDQRCQIIKAAGKLTCDELIESPVHMSVLVNCLRLEAHPDLNYEAASVLFKISMGTPRQVEALVSSGAVSHFVKLLDIIYLDPSPLAKAHFKVLNQVLMAVSNIIKQRREMREIFVSHGLVDTLWKLMNQAAHIPNSLLRFVMWAWVDLCFFQFPEQYPSSIMIIDKLLSGFYKLMKHPDLFILENALKGLTELIDKGTDKQIAFMMEDVQVHFFVNLLSHKDPNVREAALNIVFRIAEYGSDQQTSIVAYTLPVPLRERLMSYLDSRLEQD